MAEKKTKKQKLFEKLCSWDDSPHWRYVVSLVVGASTEETHTPPEDPHLTKKHYEDLQRAAALLNNLRWDLLDLPKKLEEEQEGRYDELIKFVAQAENRTRGAVQMCEQLMFGGDPTYGTPE